jgi:hypothetical protein
MNVASSPVALDTEIKPYTPGINAKPAIANPGSLRVLTSYEENEAIQAAAYLGDPNRIVLHHDQNRSPQNAIAGGNGEAVGMWASIIAQGSVTNMGVQPNYITNNGAMFFHTHIFNSNACFEYGINYSYAAPYLFGYNWCTGGNTPEGFMVYGLVGPTGGALNRWQSNGNGYLIAWDSTMGQYKISIEEVLESDGAWHLLGYNWSTTKFVDLMNGRGVTGTKSNCCGWAVFEIHGAPGSTCKFDSAFPAGQHLMYDLKKQVLLKNTWTRLDKVGGLSAGTQIDCADISGLSHPGYTSPYFSGEYYAAPVNGQYGPTYAGDWWLTQR